LLLLVSSNTAAVQSDHELSAQKGAVTSGTTHCVAAKVLSAPSALNTVSQAYYRHEKTERERENRKTNKGDVEHILSGEHTLMTPFPPLPTQLSEVGQQPPKPQPEVPRGHVP
jgi:hypothetical protein